MQASLIEEQRKLQLAPNYLEWQRRLVLPEIGQRVLELGCGIGNFTAALLDREAVIAVDLDAESIALMRQRYGERPNLRTVQCDVASDGFLSLAGLRPDSCVCLNMLEHVERDVEALQRVREVLPGKGVIALLVPAFQAIFGPLDRRLGHYRRYDRASLQLAARNAGLRIRKIHYVNLPGFLVWGAGARIFDREKFSTGQIQVYDRCVVPLAAKLESVIKPPFGQSLFAVLEKP